MMSPLKETMDRSDKSVQAPTTPSALAVATLVTRVVNVKPPGANTATGKGKGKGKKNWGKKQRPVPSGGRSQHNPHNPAASAKPKFTGTCKKDLQGTVIIWYPNKQQMTQQFKAFEKILLIVAGKISTEIG